MMMALSRTVSIVILILSCIFQAYALDTTVTNLLCNTDKYSDDDNYSYSVERVLQDLPYYTPYSGYNYFTAYNNNGDICYGHATCNDYLSKDDCSSCVSKASDDVVNQCFQSIGVQIQLYDCSLRYEDYPFTA